MQCLDSFKDGFRSGMDILERLLTGCDRHRYEFGTLEQVEIVSPRRFVFNQGDVQIRVDLSGGEIDPATAREAARRLLEAADIVEGRAAA